MIRRRPLAATVVSAALVLAACGGDDDGPGAGNGPGNGADGDAGTAVIATPVPPRPTSPPLTTDIPPASGPTTSLAPARPLVDVGDPQVAFEEVVRLQQPNGLAWRVDDPTLYLVDQPGRIVAVDPATGADRVVLDITDLTEAAGERGLLGLAFAPAGDLAYVNYSGLRGTGSAGRTVVAEYRVDAAGAFDRASARVVLEIDQPYRNHNGGHLTFGPDDMLYIGMGDGGSGGDPERLALDPTSPHGSLLRIDPAPTPDASYTVPDDNPFLDVDGALPETFAIGLRNPWKFTFDPLTADLWIADVGQNRFEEVNFVPAPADGGVAGAGLSFGWSAFEGNERFNTDVDPEGHTPPVLTYENGPDGCSVIGGAPYRGEAIPELWGGYVYSDLCAGTIWVLDLAGRRNLRIGGLSRVTAVLPGPDQELYVVSADGPVHRIVPAG